MLEASYARDLHFYIVAPNLRINVTTWRPSEASYSAFLAERSKALQGYTGYQGNSQLIVDEATAYDYGMPMSIRSLDENGVRKVNDPNENERKHLVDNLWYEKRDESTINDKTQDPKIHKELVALFKATEMIKTEKTNTTVFPIATVSIDAQPGMVSLTLRLLVVMARNLAKQNETEPRHLSKLASSFTRNFESSRSAARHSVPGTFVQYISVLAPQFRPGRIQSR